jgi:hypothetical protein
MRVTRRSLAVELRFAIYRDDQVDSKETRSQMKLGSASIP